MDRGRDNSASFLPLAEAAERLSISRLKLREAIANGAVPARRDNQGEWRVDLTDIQSFPHQDNGIETTPDVLMGLLFDEIEALCLELQNSSSLTERLTGLAGAQHVALEKATAALDKVTSERDRFASVAGRALDAAGLAGAQVAALGSTADRALGLLDHATHALEQARVDAAVKDQQIAAQNGQMDRLFTLSEQAVTKAGRANSPGWIARIFGLSGQPKR